MDGDIEEEEDRYDDDRVWEALFFLSRVVDVVDFVVAGRSLVVDPSVLAVGFVSLGASVLCFAVSDPEGAFLVVILVDDFVLGAGDFVAF